jgi:hypothetical protein
MTTHISDPDHMGNLNAVVTTIVHSFDESGAAF